MYRFIEISPFNSELLTMPNLWHGIYIWIEFAKEEIHPVSKTMADNLLVNFFYKYF